MNTKTLMEAKQGSLPEKVDLSHDIACRSLQESGLLTGLPDTDVAWILTNLTYELLPFQKGEQLIHRNQFMTYFLILDEGSLKSSSLGIGEGMFCEDRIVGLEICVRKTKISYMDVYAAADGLAVKYHFPKLLDTRGISPVSKVRLMTNITQYVANKGIEMFHAIESLNNEIAAGYKE